MEKDDTGHFHGQVELKDGQYEYKFRVRSRSWFLEPDEWVSVTDPYATAIVDDDSQNGVLVIKDGDRITDTYVWQHDDQSLPPDDALVIYEMHIGDFAGGDSQSGSDCERVIEKLDYLVNLGINAIEFMPFMEFPGQESRGYNPRHFFACESSYGTSANLKRLIDECHARGIRVIMDAIFNHSESSGPLTQIDHDYWYHHSPRDPDNSWGPEFNLAHYDEKLETYPARKFLGDVVRYWVDQYHIDGIRYDAARQLGNYDFMHWIVQEAETATPVKPFYNVAEHIPETTEITNADGPMDGCWHESFYHTVKAHICGDRFDIDQLKDALDAKRQGFMGPTNVVNYLTNHDQKRLMVELGDRDIFDEAAFDRIKLGFALLMTAVGIPLVLMGEEFGAYQSLEGGDNKIGWSLLENDANHSLLDYCSGLINLRKTTHALYTANIDFFHEDLESKVIAYGRWNGEGSRVVVVANFSDRFLEGYRVSPMPAASGWREWTRGYDVEAGEELAIDIGGYEAQVFVSQ